jgi:hypothetical protein
VPVQAVAIVVYEGIQALDVAAAPTAMKQYWLPLTAIRCGRRTAYDWWPT